MYHKTTEDCSRKVALNYSTSFSLGIRLLSAEYRSAVFSIYGLVRVADEIVDTFHDFDKVQLLKDFREETYKAIEQKISTNPILNAFQIVANQYQIGKDLIDPFFNSMEEDLETSEHNEGSYQEYIYGSAEVVGLMCLKVFCNGNEEYYRQLVPYARSLGAAFQKVNFLRDLQSDFEDRGRVYFPSVNFNDFQNHDKVKIIEDIKKDFEHAMKGIKMLPAGSRLGVYTAYIYYLKLLEKIERKEATEIMKSRIRIPNPQKIGLMVKSFVKEKMMQNAAM